MRILFWRKQRRSTESREPRQPKQRENVPAIFADELVLGAWSELFVCAVCNAPVSEALEYQSGGGGAEMWGCIKCGARYTRGPFYIELVQPSKADNGGEDWRRQP